MIANDPLEATVFVIFGGADDSACQQPALEARQTTAPSGFPSYAAGTWGPENTQGLLAAEHRWPLLTELKSPDDRPDPEPTGKVRK